MITTIPNTVRELQRGVLGYKVTATARAHANADVDTFTVAGGLVSITLMYGIITVAPALAVNIIPGNNPTLGGATSVIYGVAADMNGAAIGDYIVMEYTAGQLTTHVAAGLQNASYNLMAMTGTIFIRGDAVQGTSQWTLFYVPIDAGASVVTV